MPIKMVTGTSYPNDSLFETLLVAAPRGIEWMTLCESHVLRCQEITSGVYSLTIGTFKKYVCCWWNICFDLLTKWIQTSRIQIHACVAVDRRISAKLHDTLDFEQHYRPSESRRVMLNLNVFEKYWLVFRFDCHWLLNDMSKSLQVKRDLFKFRKTIYLIKSISKSALPGCSIAVSFAYPPVGAQINPHQLCLTVSIPHLLDLLRFVKSHPHFASVHQIYDYYNYEIVPANQLPKWISLN